MDKELLIIFLRNPQLGKVKTRLASSIGEVQALEIYNLLLNRTRTITQGLAFDKVVYYSDFIDNNDDWSSTNYKKALQMGDSLGQKIHQAFQQGFDGGYNKIGIIGSDCYELDQHTIKRAFYELNTHDLVVGPATDGGYYLLGMKTMIPSLFKNKLWSTPLVLEDTLNDAKTLDLTVKLLNELTDVDSEQDLNTIRELIRKS